MDKFENINYNDQPDGAETIGRAYFKDGETCKRTYIVSCPNFERG